MLSFSSVLDIPLTFYNILVVEFLLPDFTHRSTFTNVLNIAAEPEPQRRYNLK